MGYLQNRERKLSPRQLYHPVRVDQKVGVVVEGMYERKCKIYHVVKKILHGFKNYVRENMHANLHGCLKIANEFVIFSKSVELILLVI